MELARKQYDILETLATSKKRSLGTAWGPSIVY